jgi:hypothetical protein
MLPGLPIRRTLAEMMKLFGAWAAKDSHMATLAPAPHDGYSSLLAELKERIRAARVRAAVTVNRELILHDRSEPEAPSAHIARLAFSVFANRLHPSSRLV